MFFDKTFILILLLILAMMGYVPLLWILVIVLVLFYLELSC